MNRKERRIAEAQNKKLSPNNVQSLGQSSVIDTSYFKALQFHQLGNLDEAEKLYKTILATHSTHPDSLG